MDEETIRVAQASAHVDATKAQLKSTLGTVKARLAPRTLAADTAETIKRQASDAARASIDAARARPATLVGIAAAATLLVFRKSIFGAIRQSRPHPDDQEKISGE